MKQGAVLVVDFDGCYLRNDFFAEQIIGKIISNPFYLLTEKTRKMSWVELKNKVLGDLMISYPVSQLVNTSVADFIVRNRAQYAKVVMVSASPQDFVRRVLKDDTLFDEIYGSTIINLKGEEKLAFIRSKFGDDFHYIGNSSDDDVILRSSKRGFKVVKHTLQNYDR